MWQDVARIGCGAADCTGMTGVGAVPALSWPFRLYCNYATFMSWGALHGVPYEQGESCAKCPNTCKDNLCGKSVVLNRICNAKSPISLFSVFVYIWQRSFDSTENESN